MTKKITVTGVMLALSVILSLVRLFDAPYGGSVTLCSMLPVLTLAILYGTKWGILSGVVYAALNMLLTGIPAPPVNNAASYLLVVFLDYVLAFGGLGLAGGVYRLIRNKIPAVPIAAAVGILFRFVCHFLSGILIWHVYAWEGVGAAMYSFLYNGSYMLFELLITVSLIAVCAKWIVKEAEKLRVTEVI